MSLGAALVDKARTVSKAKTGSRVNGAQVKETVNGTWFRCMYDPAAGTEGKDDGGVRRRRGATLLVGRSDTVGERVVIKASDTLEIVHSATGQTVLMQVQGDPDPIAKKRTVLGWQCDLARVTR